MRDPKKKKWQLVLRKYIRCLHEGEGEKGSVKTTLKRWVLLVILNLKKNSTSPEAVRHRHLDHISNVSTYFLIGNQLLQRVMMDQQKKQNNYANRRDDVTKSKKWKRKLAISQ